MVMSCFQERCQWPVLLCGEVPKWHRPFPPEFTAQVQPQELPFPKRREYERSPRLNSAYASIEAVPPTLRTSKSCDTSIAGSSRASSPLCAGRTARCSHPFLLVGRQPQCRSCPGYVAVSCQKRGPAPGENAAVRAVERVAAALHAACTPLRSIH